MELGRKSSCRRAEAEGMARLLVAPLCTALLVVALLVGTGCSARQPSFSAVAVADCSRELLRTRSIEALPVVRLQLESRSPLQYLELHLQPAEDGRRLLIVGINPLTGREFISAVHYEALPASDPSRRADDLLSRIAIVAPARFLSRRQVEEITLLLLMFHHAAGVPETTTMAPLCSAEAAPLQCGALQFSARCVHTEEGYGFKVEDEQLESSYTFSY